MDSKERRKYIEEKLVENPNPIKGQQLALNLGVTRQIIVKDIAILRAEGKNIIATPEGYIIPNEDKTLVKKMLAFSHDPADMEDELITIVSLGGIVQEVIIEHPVYGEIRGILMIKDVDEVKKFIKKFKEFDAEPLSALTGGIHLHTITAKDQETINKIIDELKKKNYLILD